MTGVGPCIRAGSPANHQPRRYSRSPGFRTPTRLNTCVEIIALGAATASPPQSDYIGCPSFLYEATVVDVSAGLASLVLVGVAVLAWMVAAIRHTDSSPHERRLSNKPLCRPLHTVPHHADSPYPHA
jgi:hypothetical protein